MIWAGRVITSSTENSAMAVIVLVHGIAQEQYSADLLESKWLPALWAACAPGFPDIADKIWRASPWRHRGPHGLLRPPVPPALVQGLGAEGLSPEQVELAEQLSLEWLERAETRSSNAGQRRTAATELVYLRPDPARQAQGVRSAVRVAWKSLARLRWFALLGNAVAERFVLWVRCRR